MRGDLGDQEPGAPHRPAETPSPRAARPSRNQGVVPSHASRVTAGVGLPEPVLPRTYGAGGLAPFDDWDWSVAVQAAIPLFTGGARAAERARIEKELSGFRFERMSVAQRVEQRLRAAMHTAGASNAGIGLARQAAASARQNLELVSDAYAKGLVSIIDLLDAQNATFVADLTAANALYDFVLDLMEVERARGSFSFFGSPAEREDYFARLETYVEEHGIPRPDPGPRR